MKSDTIQIADRTVGPASPTFVIAEIGVNHDGSLARGLELVRHAKQGGADAIKLQLFNADRLVHASATAANYQKHACGATDQASLLRRLELDERDVATVIAAASDAGLVTIATPFSLEDVDAIERLGLPAIKIASPDLVNKPLLDRAAATGKPLLVSTGAATIDEIDRCVGWLDARGAAFSLLHCVSSYPTPIDEAHLAWIGDLRRRYGVAVGYSDHATDPLAGALAVAAGACVIEKHLTWNRFAEGPDHLASADPTQFAAYARGVRLADRMRGASPSRVVLPIEEDVRKLSRQSLVAARAIRAGERIERSMLRVQRPGTGIPAAELDAVVGRGATRDVAAGTLLSWEMLADAARTDAA